MQDRTLEGFSVQNLVSGLRVMDVLALKGRTFQSLFSHFVNYCVIARLRLSPFTALIIPNLGAHYRGVVKLFDLNVSFGCIKADADYVFVHSTPIKGTKRHFRGGETVEFDILETEKGPQAQDVKPALTLNHA